MSDEATQHNENMLLTQYIRNHIISKGMCQLVADERSKTFERIENVEDYSFFGRKYIVHAHDGNNEHFQALVVLPQRTINELVAKYRKSQQSDEPKLPRDTQFLQSAKLLYDALDKRDYLWVAFDDEPHVMELIAHFAYDLISSACIDISNSQIKQGNAMTHPNNMLRAVKDITEFSEVTQ